MSSLLEGARRLVTRSPDVGARVEGLAQATDAARGRLDDAAVDAAEAAVERASARLRLSADHTVVALAGATGSGKSSTFNALTDLELSAVGVRRPTTSWATACVWGHEGAPELLEWLGIPARHQVTRDSMLSSGRGDEALKGVVLLDLPDHDSTEVAHHLEVDRLVDLADMLVWVLDPQKYADAAVHDRYLKKLVGHEEVVVVVLNQIDLVPESRRASMVADVRRLLAEDGLHEVTVIPVSAREGWGIDELEAEIARRVAAKKANKARMVADVKAAAASLAEVSGDAKAPQLPADRVAALDDAFATSAGVPVVVSAVEDSTRLRANRATGWPVVSWFTRLKPDPLKRLHLDLGAAGKELTGTARTSVPQATGVQRARVDTEVRALADQVSAGLTPPWAAAVRRASVSRLDDLGDRLDAAIGSVDLGATRIPGWAGAVRVLQWLLILVAVGGLGWLLAIAGASFLGLGDLATPTVGGLPIPTVMFLGGILLGLVLAAICRALVRATARRRAATADKRLRDAISSVSQELVVSPVMAELAAYARVREGLAAAQK